MSEIKFLKTIDGYQDEVTVNINKKNAVIAGLQKKVEDKQKEIGTKQDRYTEKPSEALFQELLVLKRELVTLKINVVSASEIITIPAVREIPAEEVTREVEEFIKGLKLWTLKDNISKAKAEYLDNLAIFVNRLDELEVFRNEVAVANIGYDAIIGSQNLFDQHKDSYTINEESVLPYQTIENTRARIATQAVRIYHKF